MQHKCTRCRGSNHTGSAAQCICGDGSLVGLVQGLEYLANKCSNENKTLRSQLAAILLERDGHRGYGETVRHLREDVRNLREENDGLREALRQVWDMVDDVLYDPCWHPVDDTGKEICGDDRYLLDHPVQNQHMPALRNWFVEFHKKLDPAALTPPA